MFQEQIVFVCVGTAFLLTGLFLSFNARFARWSVNYGRARIWVSLLGENRAIKLTRYFFGPLVCIFGLATFALLLVPHGK